MVTISVFAQVDTQEEMAEVLKRFSTPELNSFHCELRIGHGPAGVPAAVEPQQGDTEGVDDPEAKPEKKLDIVAVRAILRKVMELKGAEGMREILRKYGGEKLAEVDEKRYPAIAADAQEVLGAS